MIRYCFRCGREATYDPDAYDWMLGTKPAWICQVDHRNATAARHPWKISPDGAVRSRRTGEVLGRVEEFDGDWAACGEKVKTAALGTLWGITHFHKSRTAAARALWSRRHGGCK